MKFWTVDAFTHTLFHGNPAAVFICNTFPTDEVMQNIASEFNLSETAFVVPLQENHFQIRWFTPTIEVDLCGHATLAAAHIVWTETQQTTGDAIYFESKSGVLKAIKNQTSITLDFPAHAIEDTTVPNGLIEAISAVPVFVGVSHHTCVVELHSAQDVINLQPHFSWVLDLPFRSLLVTAEGPAGGSYDYVCRFFSPRSGVYEDPVTGSAHCKLGPYWSHRLKKNELRAFQASKRGGALIVKHEGNRVLLIGEAITVFTGQLSGALVGAEDS